MVTEQLFLAAKLLIHPSSKEPDYLLMLVLSNHSPGFLKVKDNAKDNSFTVLKLHFFCTNKIIPNMKIWHISP